MSEITTRPERPLSFLEKFEVSKQLLHAYGNITFTATLEHEATDNETTAEEFYIHHFHPALTALIEAHPPLSMVLRDKSKSTAHFEQLSSIDLAQVVAMSDNSMPLQELIRQETSKEFDTESLLPLWRLRVMSETSTRCTVVLVLNHVIGDGISLTIFFRAFLQELNKNNNNNNKKSSSTIIQVQEKKVALPYESSNPPSASLIRDGVPVLAKGLVPKVFPKPIARMVTPVGTDGWKGDVAAVEGEIHDSEIRLIHVPAGIWKPITSECKRRGISAHSIVFITMLLAWRRLYPGEMTEFSAAINCRGFCNPPLPKDLMGNYVSVFTSYWTHKKIERQQNNIWEMATKYHHLLQKKKLIAARQSLLLKYLPKYPASYLDHWYGKRKSSALGRNGGLEISDLGRFIVGKEGDTWKAKEIYFCQGAHTFNAGLGMNTICYDDSLFCAFDWQKGSLDPSKINLYHNTFFDVLNEIPLK